MEKILQVFDDIIPLYQQDFIEKLLTNKVKDNKFCWMYNSNLTTPSSNNTLEEVGFSRNLFSYDNIYSLLSPFYKFCEIQNIIPYNLSNVRTFLQTPNPNPSTQEPHTDQDKPHLVFLYYVKDSDGDTVFYDKNKKILKKVTPKKGRVVSFDGSILHAGSSPSKSTRIIINVNYQPNFTK